MSKSNQVLSQVGDSTVSSMGRFAVELQVEERAGLRRHHEPVTVGVPMPKGALVDPSRLILLDREGRPVLLQAELLAQWSDGSAKCVLLDFLADVDANQTANYSLRPSAQQPQVGAGAGLTVQTSPELIVVDTGSAAYFIDRRVFKPFGRVVMGGAEILEDNRSGIRLIDDRDRECLPVLDDISVETQGPVRLTLCARGKSCSPGAEPFGDFTSRLNFYANSDLVEMKFTLRNPRAARHPGGLWDLGDEGSVHFRELSVQLALCRARARKILWHSGGGRDWETAEISRLEIYQDSSGGENWQSSNHVNRFGQVGCSFRGYRVTAGDALVREGDRITPTASIRSEDGNVSVAVEKFWQNFPKAIGIDGDQVAIGLFPRQFNDLYELQGGEQKTHTVYFSFQAPRGRASNFDWVHHRLVPRVPSSWHSESMAVPYLASRQPAGNKEDSIELVESLVDTAVEGNNTFFHRREIIDEYGWRNFGDLYADHEAVGHAGNRPLIAHYNNQYDVIYGAIIQYLRSSNHDWFELAKDLALHVIDIDIYHTSEDRDAFNGGLFWHTQHYTDAATATHRTYSKSALGENSRFQAGGGPSNEHNYTTGLLYYYLLTGDPAAKEAVQGLADWVIHMDRRLHGLLGAIDQRPRGFASKTASWDYHGPGRGCGNSVNALLDAYLLTRDEKYCLKTEELIRRSIHPNDDVESRNLDDVEHRWSYTVFLQSLGKYLDVKTEDGRMDHMYAYGRESLLHYARWILDHEVPYKEVLHKVEIPTETWPAQDIRKCNVLNFAAKYADESLRDRLLDKAKFFFERCIHDLRGFPTCTLTRPVVLLMTNGYMQSYFATGRVQPAPRPAEQFHHGAPRAFKPQFYELYKARQYAFHALGLINDFRRRTREILSRKRRGMVGERA